MGKKYGSLILTVILALSLYVFLFDHDVQKDALELGVSKASQGDVSLKTAPLPKQFRSESTDSASLQSTDSAPADVALTPESVLIYRKLNDSFFNSLSFTDERSLQKLVALGFPSEKDILFAQQYSTSELAQGLIGTVGFTKLHAQIEQNPEVSKSGLVVIGFANALSEYEAAIRYYHPTYHNGDSLAELSWPNDKVPALVSEQFDNLNYLQAAVKSDSAAGALVKAKFDIVTAQLAGSENIPDMTIEFLASAQRELGSTVIAEYVEANYPQQSRKFYSSIQALE